MEVGVEILADLAVCGLSCKPFVFRVFLAFELKHYFAYFFCVFAVCVLFWPFPSLTLGDLLCVSILDLVRILGSTRGWFPVNCFGS